MAAGINAISVAAEFAQHAAEEQGHADMIAARITQLCGEPDFNPEGRVTRAHSDPTLAVWLDSPRRCVGGNSFN